MNEYCKEYVSPSAERFAAAAANFVNEVAAIAYEDGQAVGREEGYSEGFREGYSRCYEDLLPAIADGLRHSSPVCAKVMNARKQTK